MVAIRLIAHTRSPTEGETSWLQEPAVAAPPHCAGMSPKKPRHPPSCDEETSKRSTRLRHDRHAEDTESEVSARDGVEEVAVAEMNVAVDGVPMPKPIDRANKTPSSSEPRKMQTEDEPSLTGGSMCVFAANAAPAEDEPPRSTGGGKTPEHPTGTSPATSATAAVPEAVVAPEAGDVVQVGATLRPEYRAHGLGALDDTHPA
mmetsp:Transcript_5629/g.18103  ORF Transcript_5629/g.18103 Transcript_5629/m.18103 type:complete len:203 (-) Transcript_5629:502-1110(-)